MLPSLALDAGRASFCPVCGCSPPSTFFSELDGVSPSARMVSSLDSTPARKEPHLEEAFFVVFGVDAISGATVEDLNILATW